MKLTDYLNSINFTKENLMDDTPDGEAAEKAYTPFVINRCMSGFLDTILFANEMNSRPHLSKKMQYDFLLNSVRKRKRFSPWLKPETIENLDIVKEYYGYNNSKAQEALSLLSDEDILNIKMKLEKGGRSSTYGL
jgi:hypothetical protein